MGGPGLPFREETDALGARLLPADVAYGIQTARAVENFSISGRTIAGIEGFVPAIVTIKQAAARAHRRTGGLDAAIAGAIDWAASDYLCDPPAGDFPVDIYHGGGGTAANMNVNEVLANRASELLCGIRGPAPVHPNTHVNMGQSTNDVIPSAMKMAVGGQLATLRAALAELIEALRGREAAFADVVKLARTCLQDALPITLAQQFSGYRAAFERQAADLVALEAACLGLPLGATAVGTCFGASADYRGAVFEELSAITGKAYHAEDNLFDALQNADFWVRVSSGLKSVALTLSKFSADLRLMSSGPRAGLGEIELPAVQPGSSIMPGKVNPVLPEMMMQVAFRVIGNDATVTRAAEGELDLNVWESIILEAVSESVRLMARAIPLFAANCVAGIRANAERCLADASGSLALSTVLAALYDYPTASAVAKHAAEQGISVRDAAVAQGLMTVDEAQALFADIAAFADPARAEDLIARFRVLKQGRHLPACNGHMPRV
ncbi:lyase family protein [Rhizobiaceae bacterium BDR2-2]|uniref:Lyase family protein n=1 Tax=Ectorhizobium quercum TaxID=2965071 RepID=A0AAE3MXY0_9HYPH|nr:lyase family protein [Ectorhizobium quercum]MCX8997263.1 lyase family protein [Ectorhizobium quercum]